MFLYNTHPWIVDIESDTIIENFQDVFLHFLIYFYHLSLSHIKRVYILQSTFVSTLSFQEFMSNNFCLKNTHKLQT